MASCPNCAAEVAPSVLSCANCRLPLNSALQPPESNRPLFRGDQTVVRSADSSPRTVSLGEATLPTPVSHPSYWPDASYGPGPSYGSSAGGSYEVPYPSVPEEPDSRAVRTRRNTIALVALGGTVLAIALVSIVVVLWSMTTPTAEPHRSQQPVASPSVAVSAAPPPPASAPSSASSRWASAQGPTVVPDGAKACSATIAVPASSTSCEFAAAVAAVVATVDPTSINFQVTAHSPVTQQDYVMTCVRNPALTTCTGGTNATVWIRNGG